MNRQARPNSTVKKVLFLGFVALAYSAAVAAGLMFGALAEGLVVVWPASAVGLAILLLNNKRAWHTLLVIFFLVNVTVPILFGISVPVVLILALIRTVEPAVSAWILIRWVGKHAWFTRLNHFLMLWVVAVGFSAVIAFFGALVEWWFYQANYVISWQVWWIGTGAIVIVLTPFLLMWASVRPSLPAVGWKRGLEVAAFTLLLIVATWVSFGVDHTFRTLEPMPYLIYPLLGLASLRSGVRGTVTAMVLLYAMVLSITAAGMGDFPLGGVNAVERITAVQLYLGVSTIFMSLISVTYREQQQAESALENSLQRLAGHIENSPLAIIEFDHDLRVKRWSKEAQKIFGWGANEVSGRSYNDLRWVYEDDREMVAEKLVSLGESGSPTSFIAIRNYRKDGSIVYCEWYSSVIYDRSGKLISVLSQVLDVTERVQTEKINQARLKITNFAITHSLDQVLRFVLDEIEKATGSRIGFFHFLDSNQQTLWLQNWSSRTVNEFCSAEGKGAHYAVDQAGIWADCIRQRKVIVHNDYANQPDRKGLPPGHADVLRELVVPIFRGEQIVAILGVGNKPREYDDKDVEVASKLADLSWDIAERKKIEKELVESELRYRIVADNTYDWEFWRDSNGFFYHNSPSCASITGYDVDAFIQNPDLYDDIIFMEDQKLYRDHRLTAERVKKPSGIDYRIVRKDGEIRWISHICQPVYDDNGNYRGVRGSNRDVTEKKKAEFDLQQSLLEKEMLMKELQHRTKNNLNVVISLLQFGQNSVTDPLARDVFSDVQSRIYSMVAIYDQLYRKGMVDQIELGQYVQSLASELSATYLPVNGRVKMEIKVEEVLFDLRRAVPLGLIFNELVLNALKYAFPTMTEGVIQVELKRNDSKVILMVRDNGIGMPAENTPTQGSGTGLKLVKLLAKQIRADFVIESGEGTRASIVLSAYA